MSAFDRMQMEIEKIIDELFENNSAIRGITISTHGGKNIYSSFLETFDLNQSELAAAITSLLFLAGNMTEKLLNQKVSYTITKGKKWILLCMMNKVITGSVIFDRKLADLSGVPELRNDMQELFLRISAIVETSEVIKEDLFVQVKRAIPNALSIAIINKEGLPIKVESAMEGPKIAAFIYALHQLSNMILSKNAQYTQIGGTYGTIIVQQIDEERILGIAVPEHDDHKLGKYMAKLEEIRSKD